MCAGAALATGAGAASPTNANRSRKARRVDSATPGSPRLDQLGPNFALARDLMVARLAVISRSEWTW